MRSPRWPHPLFINHPLARQMLDFLSLQQAMGSTEQYSHTHSDHTYHSSSRVQHSTKQLFKLVFSSVSLLNGSFIKRLLQSLPVCVCVYSCYSDCTGPLEQYSDVDMDDAIATISLVTQSVEPFNKGSITSRLTELNTNLNSCLVLCCTRLLLCRCGLSGCGYIVQCCPLPAVVRGSPAFAALAGG